MKQRFHRDTNEVIASLCACNGSASNNQKSDFRISVFIRNCRFRLVIWLLE
ncbi:MAG TPA: hypothetical protein VJC39_02010 [Candidatus Nanoarchaeia archaeon]|nr:hypothetical protein [Candidatus Nanoarchaeia archaeon]